MKTRILERIVEQAGLKPRASWPQDYQKAVDDHALRCKKSSKSCEQDLLGDDFRLRQFAGNFTVGETYFLRHPEHYDHFVQFAEERLLRHPHDRLTVWSAGCASGEEAYSALIALVEKLQKFQLSQVAIIATDISKAAISKAQSREYTSWSMRGVSDVILDKYFSLLDGGSYRLADRIAQSVQFEVSTLQQKMFDFSANSVDVIFFRNVGIYLTQQALDSMFEGFARILKPGGLLFVAPGDPRPELSELALQATHDGTHYKKMDPFATLLTPEAPVNAEKADVPQPVLARPRRLAVSANSQGHSRTDLLAGRSNPVIAAERVPAPALPRPVLVQSAPEPSVPERVEAHKDVVNTSEASRVAEDMLARFPEEAEGWILRGRLRLEQGDGQKAAEDLRRAVYLDCKDRLARFWYASALNEIGQQNEARTQFKYLHQDLRKYPAETVLEDKSTSVGELVVHVEFILSECL